MGKSGRQPPGAVILSRVDDEGPYTGSAVGIFVECVSQAPYVWSFGALRQPQDDGGVGTRQLRARRYSLTSSDSFGDVHA